MKVNGGYDDRTRIDPESGHRLARLVLLPMDASNLGEGNLRMEEVFRRLKSFHKKYFKYRYRTQQVYTLCNKTVT